MIQLQYQVNLCQSFYQIKVIKRLAKLLKAFLSKYKIRLVKQKTVKTLENCAAKTHNSHEL